MVVAIPLGAFVVVILAVLIRLLILVMFGYFLNGMADKVPIIGGQIKKGIAAVLNFLEAKWDAYVQPHLDRGTEWLTGLAVSIRDLPETVAEFTTATASAVERLVDVTIPRMIGAATAPLGQGIDYLGGRLDTHLGRLNVLDSALDVLRKTTIPNLRDSLGAGIDDLRGITIPSLRAELWKGIDDLRGTLDARFRGVRDYVDSRVDALRGFDLPALDRRLLEQAATVAGLAATVATVVLPAVEVVTKCRRKIGWLCTTDETLWDDVFGDVIPFIGLAAAVAMVEEMQELAPSAVEGVRAILDG